MPARSYQIKVRGVAGPTTVAVFPELDVVTDGDDSVLRGTLADQAALYGVLGRVQDLGIELLEVRSEELPAAEDAPPERRVTREDTEQLGVLVVSGRPACREALRDLVDAQPDLVAVGEAATVLDARAAPVQPDVVVTEVDLEDGAGPDVIEALREALAPCALLVVGATSSRTDLRAVLAAGVEGYVSEVVGPAEILHAVRAVADGRTYLQASVAAALAG